MSHRTRSMLLIAGAALVAGSSPATAELSLNLGSEEVVQADGTDISVPGYSVPSFEDWNSDGLKDLIIGEGSGIVPNARVRVYLNRGAESAPEFSSFFYAQANGSDLTATGGG